jgi:hypothetical protein
MNKDNKQLMFAISNSLSKLDAVQFAQTLDQNTKYYLAKTHENSKARHLAKRERFVIVRYPQKNEIIRDGWVIFVEKHGLMLIN